MVDGQVVRGGNGGEEERGGKRVEKKWAVKNGMKENEIGW